MDAQKALDRIEGAGGRLYSATEQLDDSPNGVMVRNILLSIAQGERDRARASFRASQLSALERGIHVAGTIPVGYRRNEATRQLEIDPDTAPIVRGLFERRTKGWGWVRLATWATQQGHRMADRTAAGVIANRVYLGEARGGGEVRPDAHPAIISSGLFARAQRKGKHSRRSGVLSGRFLLVGIATCDACGRGLRLSQGNHGLPFYTCRGVDCPARAYSRAQALDDFVLNTVEEWLSHGAEAATWEAATFATSPGDSREVEDAEAALEEARADLDSFLADTNLRRILGPDKHAEAASSYVAIVNQAAADLAEARERHTGRRALVGHLWLHEWGQAERHEWLERMVRSVVVSRGREPLSRRCEVELR